MEIGQASGIARAVATDFFERGRRVGTGAERVAIGQWQEILHRPLEDA